MNKDKEPNQKAKLINTNIFGIDFLRRGKSSSDNSP
jgi:hypothetical protein